MKKVAFLFPGPGNLPCGGLKMIGIYANYLAANGFDVSIVYAGSLFWKKKRLYFKLTNCVRYIQHKISGVSCRKWFPLDKKVKEHFAFSLSECHVPRADYYIASSPATAEYLKHYKIENFRKYYFIQGFENWGGVTDEQVFATYRYPFNKIVISNWLAELVRSQGENCEVVFNGFDFKRFGLDIPVKEKNKFQVMMLYHKMARKDCQMGFEALAIVKKRIPQLQVTLFGTPDKPEGLPEWYEYYQSPAQNKLRSLYNSSAVFAGTSQIEGWGLTIGEAMLCGCAVACTDNKGYLEMAHHEKTALVSPVGDSAALAENIIKLIENDDLRYDIATSGYENIQNFSQDDSCRKFLSCFDK